MAPRQEGALAINQDQTLEPTVKTAQIQLPQRYLEHDLPQALKSREFITATPAAALFEALCRFGHREMLRTMLRTSLEAKRLVSLSSSDAPEGLQREDAAKENILDQVMPNWREIKIN